MVSASKRYNNAGRFIGWSYVDDGEEPVAGNVAQESGGNLELLATTVIEAKALLERIYRELMIQSDLLVEGMDVTVIDVEDERDRPEEPHVVSGTS